MSGDKNRAVESGVKDLKVYVKQVLRTSKTVKGGRQMSFSALVIVGDGEGRVGYAKAKAREVAKAIEKATEKAKRSMFTVPLRGKTLHHKIFKKYKSSRVLLLPATPGTGIIAGSTLRALFEAIGVEDIVTKCQHSRSPMNVVKAVEKGLSSMMTLGQVARKRGITREQVVSGVS